MFGDVDMMSVGFSSSPFRSGLRGLRRVIVGGMRYSVFVAGLEMMRNGADPSLGSYQSRKNMMIGRGMNDVLTENASLSSPFVLEKYPISTDTWGRGPGSWVQPQSGSGTMACECVETSLVMYSVWRGDLSVGSPQSLGSWKHNLGDALEARLVV
jgi:hypothetical protein